MKQALIITGALIITIFLVVVWIYLLLFGAPDGEGEIFANLTLQEAPSERVILPDTESEVITNLVDSQSMALNQLTTRAVAGFMLTNFDGRPGVRYVEKGTGHIYDIDLGSGVETRTYGTTIGQTVKAIFAPGGQQLAIATETNGEWRWRYAALGTSTEDVRLQTLPIDIENVAVTETGEVKYTVSNEDTTAYRFDPEQNETTTLFSLPLFDVEVLWGSDTTYVYNRPAPFLRGGGYEVAGNALSPVTGFTFGTTLLKVGNRLAVSHYDPEAERYASSVLNPDSTETTRFSITVIPEKCAGQESGISTPKFWCAAPLQNNHRLYVRNWYQGVNQYDDLLWEIDPISGDATILIDFPSTLGYSLDVSNLAVSPDSSAMGFINRFNDTLWIYYPDRQIDGAN